MSSPPPYTITSHTIPASHIRGFARGVRSPATSHQLRLAIKQYTPLSPPPASSPAITIILAHGVGSSKETYEPFIAALLHSLPGLPIRAIWAMDAAHHGRSFLLNASVLGDEPHWLDSARDLLHAVNTFQALMPPPIVGVGQSWGCVTVAMAAAMHPRLFGGVVFVEPVFAGRSGVEGEEGEEGGRAHRGEMMMRRRDWWGSREEARRALLRSPYYAAFDPRVFERVMEFDLRDVDVDVDGGSGTGTGTDSDSPSSKDGPPVTLTTPKSQEVYTLLRPHPPLPNYPATPADTDNTTPTPTTASLPGFHRPELPTVQSSLPSLLPPTLVVWGRFSDLAAATDYHAFVMSSIGTGRGGNGGLAGGRVEEAWVDAGHAVPLEKPDEAGAVVGAWLERRVGEWEEERRGEETQPAFWVDRINPAYLARAESARKESKRGEKGKL